VSKGHVNTINISSFNTQRDVRYQNKRRVILSDAQPDTDRQVMF